MLNYPNVIVDQQQMRKAYETFLNQWNWELHITLSYYRCVDSSYVLRDAKVLLNEARHRFRKIKFAAVLIYSIYLKDSPHAHILLTSDKNYPKSLGDLDWYNFGTDNLDWIDLYWQQWKADEATCKVTKDWTNEIICSYIAKSKNITVWDADRWEFDYYRPNLLKKLALRRN